MSFCLETYLQQSEDYEVLLAKSGFKECAKIINEKAEKVFYVNPGDKVLGARLIGIPPIPVGICPSKGTIIISYTKPCHGTAAIEIPVKNEDIESIKEIAIKK
ncbi:DUF1894 domain-containing protein [Methanobrevibacter filiformis]|uniref:DUF1894 domain-containing protein n=1 Tax=Methanobrevibacter filiformis TaxID=55758 RepID=A0A162FHQ7_9EURY|nr:DUF1894 domain-containing protein [Methanobrevibacter filiformis]KZX10130.1 hypothetical protein MBFIL_18790 [Methanobrevibacter filiformis]